MMPFQWNRALMTIIIIINGIARELKNNGTDNPFLAKKKKKKGSVCLHKIKQIFPGKLKTQLLQPESVSGFCFSLQREISRHSNAFWVPGCCRKQNKVYGFSSGLGVSSHLSLSNAVLPKNSVLLSFISISVISVSLSKLGSSCFYHLFAWCWVPQNGKLDHSVINQDCILQERQDAAAPAIDNLRLVPRKWSCTCKTCKTSGRAKWGSWERPGTRSLAWDRFTQGTGVWV